MAFDKRAYNRDYYRRNKEKWEEYRDTNGMNSRYGSYGQAKAAEEARKRSVSSKSSFVRSGQQGRGMAEQAKYRSSYDYRQDTSPITRGKIDAENSRLNKLIDIQRPSTKGLTKKERNKTIKEYNRLMAEKKYLIDRSVKQSQLAGEYAKKNAPRHFIKESIGTINGKNVPDVTDEIIAYTQSKRNVPISEQAKASYARGKATLHYGNAPKNAKKSPAKSKKNSRAKKRVSNYLKKLFG